MLCLYGFDAAIRNIYSATYRSDRSGAVANMDQLRCCYLDFLGPSYASGATRTAGGIVRDIATENDLSAFFISGDPGDQKQQRVMGDAFPPTLRAEKIALAATALERLLALDEDLRALFELVIHSIIVRPHSDSAVCLGGSNSDAIGLIWMSVPAQLGERDLAELFLHELTHHLLYIDEASHAQFMYEDMLAPENFISSAILKKAKSVCKVFHSMIVGVEICTWRQRLGWGAGASVAHPCSLDLLAGVRGAHQALTALPRFDALTTPHARAILADAMDQCGALEASLGR